MKTFLLFLLTAVLVPAAESPVAKPAEDCCAKDSAEKEHACCEPLSAAPFTRNSLYQAGLTFTDDAGRAVALGSLRGRPVVVIMFFASCGYACPLLVSDLQAIRAKLPEEIRTSAAFALISFDVARDTSAALASYRAERGIDRDWFLLRGDDATVREMAALLGVKFKREMDGGFAHSNLITVLNPEGEIVHQRAGLKGGLDETAAAVVAAARK